MAIREAHRLELDERGFVRLEAFIAPERRQRLKGRIQALFDAEGEGAGGEFRPEPGARRLANLVDKGEVFADCIVEPMVLEYVGHVLGARFKLSSLNARSEPEERRIGAASRRRGRPARRAGLLGLQHRLDARRFTPEGASRRTRIASVGTTSAGGARRSPSPPSRRGPRHRQGRRPGGDELPPLARRHRQRHRPATPRATRLLLPLRQAAAAVPEGPASPGDAEGASRRGPRRARTRRPGERPALRRGRAERLLEEEPAPSARRGRPWPRRGSSTGRSTRSSGTGRQRSAIRRMRSCFGRPRMP